MLPGGEVYKYIYQCICGYLLFLITVLCNRHSALITVLFLLRISSIINCCHELKQLIRTMPKTRIDTNKLIRQKSLSKFGTDFELS